ncbi:MAG: DNA polymerase III subunit beta [Candidatus Endonucleobacter sp. (ex Gigantidas childressi)]|nr:DNA polymerase III subunit beta [Candidatus Endonucleobacter sp. (ex Gigantidas childressi)]
MKFTINREALLKPLQLVAGVVERRQILPVLSNVLMMVDNNQLSLTGTDLEVELVGRVALDDVSEEGGITVPARKLMDICKSLPINAQLEFVVDDEKVRLKTGRSRFVLSTLPANKFPSVDEEAGSLVFTVSQSQLRRLIDRTGFAMAHQDVRSYFNGMLLEVSQNCLRSVATDGHRLAMCSVEVDINQQDRHQVIVPRKGILEIARLLKDGEEEVVSITLGANHIRAKTGDFIFTSKLVDGKFPNYDHAFSRGNNIVVCDRQELKQAFQRASSIFLNEKYKGVRLILSMGLLKVIAKNFEQEKAEEEISVSYGGEDIEVRFNVNYLLDVLSVLSGDEVRIILSNNKSSVLLEEDSNNVDSSYIVMPMTL